MTKPKLGPALIDFVTAYPGPGEVQFRGGSIAVVAALIYQDGVRIEWRMRPAPDLSWMDHIAVAPRSLPEELRRSPEILQAQLEVDRLRELWAAGKLADGHGGEFELSLQRFMLLEGGWEGTASCICRPPTDSRELTLRIGAADVVIPLTFDRTRWHDAQSSEFKAGYPGPKDPLVFHGGAVKLISALIYADRVTIEWLLDPVPDLSWLHHDDPATRMTWGVADRNRSSSPPTRRETSKNVVALWLGARLTDSQGTAYLGSLGNAGTFRGGGYKGEVDFSPSVPPDARELNLVLYDLSVFISLESRWDRPASAHQA